MIAWLKRFFVAITIIGLISINILTLTNSTVNSFLSNLLDKMKIPTVTSEINNDRKRLKVENKKLTSIDKKRKIAVKGFGVKVTGRTKKLVATTLAELPAEAVPFMGIPVLIASTAYEIHLACETLNDMNSMYAEFGIDERVDTGVMNEICHPSFPSEKDLWNSIEDSSNETNVTTLERFQEIMEGTVNEMIESSKRNKQALDDEIGGTIEQIFINLGWNEN